MLVDFHICQLDTGFFVTQLLISNSELLIFYKLVGACKISSSSSLSLETFSIWMCSIANAMLFGERLRLKMLSQSYKIATCITHQRKLLVVCICLDFASFAHCNNFTFYRIEEFCL